jgi:hypothetical protein
MGKRGKRWTASYAGKVLDDADRAATDQSFARRRGIPAQRLSWWRRRLDRPRGRRSTRSPARVELIEVTGQLASTPVMVEVLLSNGRQFRVSVGVDAELIGRLADALEGG